MIADAIDRLMPEGQLAVPPRQRIAGRWARADGAEWDWYYALDTPTRRKVLRHCQPGGLAPDTCAHAAGYDYVDEWAAELVAAVLANPLEAVDAQPVELVAATDLVGPVEIAAMLDVEPGTVHVWVHRGTMPAPFAVVSGTRLWVRVEVEAWALKTGRIGGGSEQF